MSPTRDDRPETLIVCNEVQAEIVALATNVEFYVRIETDSSGRSTSDMSTVVSWVSGEAIKSLAGKICDQTIDTTPSGTRHLKDHCILSISSGTPDARIISCDPVIESSKSCTWFRGTIRLLHNSECSSDDVTTDVVGILKNVTTSDFSTTTYAALAVNVTDVEFTDAPSSEKVISDKSIESSRNKLTSSGTTVTTITALTLIGLFILLLSIRRLRRYRLNKVAFDDGGEIRGKEMKQPSHIEPNWRNIGLRHSSMDCHHCNSLVCTTCHARNEVQMLKFDRKNSLNNASQVKEMVKSDQSTPGSIEPEERIAKDKAHRSNYANTSDDVDPKRKTRFKSILL
jgi:hypothetical protein